MMDTTRNVEHLVQGLVERGRISREEGAKLLQQFLTRARRSQRDMEKMAQTGSRRVLHVVAGTVAGQVEDLQAGLVKLSHNLRTLERRSAATRPAPGRRAKPVASHQRKSTRTKSPRQKAA